MTWWKKNVLVWCEVPPSLSTDFNLLDACWKNEITFFLRLFQATLHFPWRKIDFRNVGFISLYHLFILSNLAGSQGLPVNPVTLTFSDKALIESRRSSWKRSSGKGEGEVFDNGKQTLHSTRYLHRCREEVDFVSDHSASLSSNQVTEDTGTWQNLRFPIPPKISEQHSKQIFSQRKKKFRDWMHI